MDAVHKAVCERLGQPYKRLTPMAIRDLAVAGDRACLDVCEIRANAIMGVMGDMALATGARGGVVLAGGVAKRPFGIYRHTKRYGALLQQRPRAEPM